MKRIFRTQYAIACPWGATLIWLPHASNRLFGCSEWNGYNISEWNIDIWSFYESRESSGYLSWSWSRNGIMSERGQR